ncbi:MAG: transcriptional repressor [Pseudomonadales bacterium]|nr:transcriptional repressor [Pseudomonadales bacterium]MDB2409871.1 transcriptional repressor [Pseudomonadales bacterium]MDG2035999.1 transcriptional repressor [Pseudomonadales bacterium]
MNQSITSKTLQNAEAMCLEAGVRLTTKRKRALSLLLNAPAPISAYELIDEYKNQYQESLTPMSAYRMLNFLVDEMLAHKLQSVNKYTACEHINCNHAHELPQFLICDTCKSVSEAGIKEDTLKKLKVDVTETGFSLNNQQLELHGTCRNCQSAQ